MKKILIIVSMLTTACDTLSGGQGYWDALQARDELRNAVLEQKTKLFEAAQEKISVAREKAKSIDYVRSLHAPGDIMVVSEEKEAEFYQRQKDRWKKKRKELGYE